MLIFGSIGIFVRHIPLPSEQIVFMRCVIGGGLLLLIYLFSSQAKTQSWKQIKTSMGLLCLGGLFLGLNWLFLYEAYTYASISIATVLYYLGPVIVIGVSPLLLREWITADKIIAIFMALAGLVLIIGLHTDGQQSNLGIFYAILAAVFYAALIVVNQKFKDLDSMVRTIVQIMVAGIIMAVYVLWNFTGFTPLSAEGIICLLILCVVHTALACYMYFSSQEYLRAQDVALWSYLDPASAIVFAYLFLGEQLSVLQFVGVFLILAATFVVGRLNFLTKKYE